MEELGATLQATIETPYPFSCSCLHDWRGTFGKAADGIREASNRRWGKLPAAHSNVTLPLGWFVSGGFHQPGSDGGRSIIK
jgi:hypothetical protein